MTFESIIDTLPGWLVNDGPESGIVISSRARLARNLESEVYAHRADDTTIAEITGDVLDASKGAGFNTDDFFGMDDLDELKKSVLIERHLISPALAGKSGRRGVIVKDFESCSIMINEEDHLRIQALRPGFDPVAALRAAKKTEEELAKELAFAFSKQYGFLTACPTNLGTGLRVSVLIHLPALVLTKEIQRVIRSAGQLGMAVRGFRGEGSDVIGNLFQISNQKSLGRTEESIVENLSIVVEKIIEYEKNSAQMLLKEAGNQVLDKIWRSIGILKTARVMTSHEFMNLASAVRFGLQLGVIQKPALQVLNELIITAQPGHLQERQGRVMEPMVRDASRAALMRERFVDVSV